MGMSVEEREIQWHCPFGPVIMESVISEQVHQILVNRADQLRSGTHPNSDINTETNDYRDRLAGCLSEEYSYEGALTQEEMNIIEDELTTLAAAYTSSAHQAGKIKKRLVRHKTEIIMQKPLWVNYMKAGEWNPSHNHTGDISCVTYLKVPKEINEENEKAEHTKVSNTPSAGRIEFQFGNVGMRYSSGGYIRTPEERKIFFFPAALSHMVYPFKSDTERVSMSVNFSDRIHAQETLKQVGER
jgi:hypothetical protein